MNISEETIEFLNKIISKADTVGQLVKNLNTYKDYLVLTDIYDEDILKFIDHVIKTSDKIFEIKKTFGAFDISGIILESEKEKITSKSKKKVKNKHYNHYVNTDSLDYSSGCGTSSSSNNCGSSSYSSGCGTSSSTYGRC